MALRLLAILAHPDDETLGLGGTLVRYAQEGVETFVVTATRGQAGRFKELKRGEPGHPGPAKLGEIREAELHAACKVLGVREVTLLDYMDGTLDDADPLHLAAELASHVRRIQPHVVVTFAQDGGYGHPDHVAICQGTAAALQVAADASRTDVAGPPHATAKFYLMAWDEPHWAAYQESFKKLVSNVDGVERQAKPWPDWELSAKIDTRAFWPTVWKAVQCHVSQVANYGTLGSLSAENHEGLWGWGTFYRVFSTVNGGRKKETSLFEGLTSS
jgi:LmbE family N-acetylglucosaminyl deacetylase